MICVISQVDVIIAKSVFPRFTDMGFHPSLHCVSLLILTVNIVYEILPIALIKTYNVSNISTVIHEHQNNLSLQHHVIRFFASMRQSVESLLVSDIYFRLVFVQKFQDLTKMLLKFI